MKNKLCANDENLLRITLLRFPLMMLVVWIHAWSLSYEVTSSKYLLSFDSSVGESILTRLFSNTLARAAVPMFFIISGFLFFLSNEPFNRPLYLRKCNNRIYTLLFPYLIWNTLFIVLIIIIKMIPMFHFLFDGGQYTINDIDPLSLFSLYTGFHRDMGQPIMYQFWFIRELIIVTILSPVIFVLISKLSYMVPLLIGFIWLSGIEFYQLLKVQSILFYSIGALIALKRIDLMIIDKYKRAIKYLWILFIISDLIFSIKLEYHIVSQIVHKLQILISLLFLWSISHYFLIPKIREILLKLSIYSFFLFAFHEPLLSLLTKVLYKTHLPDNNTIVLIYYIFTPLMTIAISLIVAFIIRSITPHFYELISGKKLKRIAQPVDNYTG